MRITQSMMSSNLLKNLNQSYAKLNQQFDQLNTGKKINRVSDDPVAGMNGMGYRTELARVEQYQRNTNELHNWFDNSDAALEQITSALQRTRNLAVQASNGTYDESELKNIAEEVKQIKLDLIDMANTQVNGKYIFNGTETNTPPDTDAAGNITFESGEVKIEVSSGTELVANIDGNTVFDDLFSTMDRFIAKLDGNNPDGDMDASIGELDGVIDNVINARADLGARMNRLELVENRLGQQEVIATATLSKNEDINYAEAITNLITQQSIHNAALSSGSKIIQPTLLDFLR